VSTKNKQEFEEFEEIEEIERENWPPNSP